MSKKTGKQMKNLPHNYINAMQELQQENERLRSIIDSKPDYKQLREEYFNEHVDKAGDIPKIKTHPHNLFEWFKSKMQSS